MANVCPRADASQYVSYRIQLLPRRTHSPL
jgi:hypothetical protein